VSHVSFNFNEKEGRTSKGCAVIRADRRVVYDCIPRISLTGHLHENECAARALRLRAWQVDIISGHLWVTVSSCIESVSCT